MAESSPVLLVCLFELFLRFVDIALGFLWGNLRFLEIRLRCFDFFEMFHLGCLEIVDAAIKT